MSAKATTRRCSVRYGPQIVGELSRPGGLDTLSFVYNPQWLALRGAFPVSAALPLRPAPYDHARVGPWIRNLLPYDAGRARVAAALGARETDDLTLIAALGGDAQGALTFGPEAEAPPGYLPVRDVSQLLAALEGDPLGLSRPGVSHCLSASDARIPVALLDPAPDRPRLALAVYGAITSHILHPEPAGRRGLVENRAYHLALARALGLSAADCVPGAAGSARYLLVARDDRVREGPGWNCRHREDLLQALGLETRARYARKTADRAGLAAMLALTRRILPPAEPLKFLDCVLFNALIGNGRAHAKRYAVLLHPERKMAPLTDVRGPGAQPHGDWTFAQRVGGPARRAERLTPAHWRRFAEEADLNGTFLLQRRRAMAQEALDGAARKAAESLRDPLYQGAIVEFFRRQVEQNAAALLAGR